MAPSPEQQKRFYRIHGEDHHASKLTAAMVRDIRSSPELSLKKLHAKYPFMSKPGLHYVRKGKSWKHIL
jgi:hypothetical protein